MEMPTSTVYYRMLSDDDRETVSSFVAKHYLPFETAVKCLNLTNDEIEQYARCFAVVLRQNLSIGAFDHNNQVLRGLVLNSNQDFRFNKDELEYKKSLPARVKLLDRIGSYMGRYFYELEGQTFVYLEVVAVDKQYCRRGICTELAKRTINMAIQDKIEKFVSLYTSSRSHAIGQRLGMTVKAKINMLEYQDAETNKKIFQDSELPEFWIYVIHLSLKRTSVL